MNVSVVVRPPSPRNQRLLKLHSFVTEQNLPTSSVSHDRRRDSLILFSMGNTPGLAWPGLACAIVRPPTLTQRLFFSFSRGVYIHFCMFCHCAGSTPFCNSISVRYASRLGVLVGLCGVSAAAPHDSPSNSLLAMELSSSTHP